MSGDSPTKIKIINVSHKSTENKFECVAKIDSDNAENDEDKMSVPIIILEDSQSSQMLDIALPAEQPEVDKESLNIPHPSSVRAEPEKEVPTVHLEDKITTEIDIKVPITEDIKTKDIDIKSSTKSRSPSPR